MTHTYYTQCVRYLASKIFLSSVFGFPYLFSFILNVQFALVVFKVGYLGIKKPFCQLFFAVYEGIPHPLFLFWPFSLEAQD